MAQKRMFSLEIVDTDAFLEMPTSTQALYFHLAMRADDDGFVSNPKKILRMLGGNEDDLKVLLTKRFILSFDNGIIVIKHWRINNYIQNDRYKPTKYIEQKNTLTLKENGSYTECIQNVSKLDTQIRLDEIRIDKNRLVSFIPPLLEEIKKYCLERKNVVNAERFINFYESKGWLIGKNKMKDWRAAVRTWENSEFNKPKNKLTL